MTVELLKYIQLKITRPQFLHTNPKLLWVSIQEASATPAIQNLWFAMQPLQRKTAKRLAAEAAQQQLGHPLVSEENKFALRLIFTGILVALSLTQKTALPLPSYIWVLVNTGRLRKCLLKCYAVWQLSARLCSPIHENRSSGSGPTEGSMTSAQGLQLHRHFLPHIARRGKQLAHGCAGCRADSLIPSPHPGNLYGSSLQALLVPALLHHFLLPNLEKLSVSFCRQYLPAHFSVVLANPTR